MAMGELMIRMWNLTFASRSWMSLIYLLTLSIFPPFFLTSNYFVKTTRSSVTLNLDNHL